MKRLICILMTVIFCLCGCAGPQGQESRLFSEEDIVAELEAAGAVYTEKVDIRSWQKGVEAAGLDADLADFSLYRFFYESDGLLIEGYLSIPLPLLEEAGAKPCLIYNHGGNKDYGALNGSETFMWSALLDMIVIGSNYRGCGMSEGEDGFGGEDVSDIIRLIDICEKCDFFDDEQINMFGVSRGGMMTCEVLRREDRVHRAMISGGMADAFMTYENRDDMKTVFEELVGGTPETMPEEYEKRSAVCWADEINTPLLLIHAEKDEKVSCEEAEKLAAELEKYGKEYVFLKYEDDLHGGIHEEDIGTVREWLLEKQETGRK